MTSAGAWGRLILKELRETLRDRRTLATLVLMPVLVYPLLGIAFQKFLFAQLGEQGAGEIVIALATPEEARAFRDVFSRGNQLLGREIDPGRPLPKAAGELPDPQLKFLYPNPGDPPADLDTLVREQVADLAVRIDPTAHPVAITLIFRGHSSLGETAREYVKARLQAINQDFVTNYLSEQQPPVIQPLAWKQSVLPGSPAPSFNLATLVPLVLILMTVTGAVYPAIDLTAGERERGTLEALIAAPVPRTQILLAKYVAVVTVALLTAGMNLAAMVSTAYATGFEQLLFGPQGLTWWLATLVMLLLAAFAAFFSAVILVLTSVARSFKEAQAYLIPVMLLALAPGILALLPGLKLTPAWALVPLANMVLVTRDLLAGNVSGGAVAIAVTANGVWTALALLTAAQIFGTDAVLYGSSGSWSDTFRRPAFGAATPSLNQGLVTLGVIFPAFVLIGSLPGRFADASMSMTMGLNALVLIGLFAAWPLGFACYFRIPWRTAFGLERPEHTALIAAGLSGMALWPWAYELEVSLIAPARLQWLVEFAEPLTAGLKQVPWWWKLVTLALVPAVCEELFFRGWLLRSLPTRPIVTILATAILFGLFHVLVRDALLWERFPPTAILGAILAWLAIRTGSLWPGILLHVVHNAMVLLLPSAAGWLGEWATALEQHAHLPWWLLMGTALPLGIAVWLVTRVPLRSIPVSLAEERVHS